MKAITAKFDPVTKKQVRRFLVAGCGAVGTDTAVYFLLVHNFIDHVGYDFAKFISFLSGTFVAFVVNKYWTFESTRRSFFEVAAFLILYMTTLGLNVSVNRIALDIGLNYLEEVSRNLTIVAFLAATGTSTVVNFLGQKYWVFRIRGS